MGIIVKIVLSEKAQKNKGRKVQQNVFGSQLPVGVPPRDFLTGSA